MSDLTDRLSTLAPNHRAALEWFNVRRGEHIPRPEPIGGIHVFNPRKGIQKPGPLNHVISLRQTLVSPYDDHAAVVAADGSWTYRYAQEGLDVENPASSPANKALFANRDDDVPVAVMIQVRTKPVVNYLVLGLAKVTGFSDGYFYLQGYNDFGELPLSGTTDFPYPTAATSKTPHVAEHALPFSTVEDARLRIDAQIIARQGGKAFRKAALKQFNGRCAISCWAAPQVLEAAHIVPYLGIYTNTADNALLLRADLHTLFDRDLLTIDANSLRVSIDPALKDTPYTQFEGVLVTLPQKSNEAALRMRLSERAKLSAN